MPGKKVLLLISNGKFTKVNGPFDCVIEQLKQAGIEIAVFDKIMENPLKNIIMEATDFARKNKCDFIAVLGGGAVLDSSIAISAVAVNPGEPLGLCMWRYRKRTAACQ